MRSLVALLACAAAAADEDHKLRILLIAPSMPWTFGPYVARKLSTC